MNAGELAASAVNLLLTSASTGVGTGVAELVRARLVATSQGQQVLDGVAQQTPGSVTAMRELITQVINSDPDFAARLQQAVAAAPRDQNAGRDTNYINVSGTMRRSQITVGPVTVNNTRGTRIALAVAAASAVVVLTLGGYGAIQLIDGDGTAPPADSTDPGGAAGVQGNPQEPTETGAGAPAGAPGAFPMPEGAWLVTVAYNVEDEYTRDYGFVSYVPETGEAITSPLVMHDEGMDWEPEPLGVSADLQTVLRSVELNDEERASGAIPLYSLADGSEQAVDLRGIINNAQIQPLQVIFDGTDPDILHVGCADGSVWRVNITAETASRSAETITSAELGRLNSWSFAEDGSGRIVGSEDPDDESDLPGADQLDYRETGQLPDLPGAGAEVQTDDGTVWAFGVDTSSSATMLRGYRLPAGADTWELTELSSPISLEQGGESSRVRFARPALAP
ncbi:hypothetical protein RM780_25325 [Streptomyces sp. DSM 44917]|uniref:GerMN domain-containing protein n=1 Tax=Streptomyces boetiae TaxID=3075541 RepID=A0ABU2LF79_9ACTN|nr:hypothetical protein [Streptomyces sp. DSM 44917]MDT0310249.1 hypothetical protein [Streptomyces sp. DSM 44917]